MTPYAGFIADTGSRQLVEKSHITLSMAAERITLGTKFKNDQLETGQQLERDYNPLFILEWGVFAPLP